MRPSIAAALSTLGPIHSADTVLLTATDVDRFADVEGPNEGHRRVVVRPDGSLLLVVEFDAPTFDQMSYAFVGAVPKDAWTWADPKKRQPAPLALGVREIKLGVADLDALANGGSATWSLGSPKIVLTADADARAALRPAAPARVNLDARDIHCLTQGGEIHRGATVGTTTDGRAALRCGDLVDSLLSLNNLFAVGAIETATGKGLDTMAADRFGLIRGDGEPDAAFRARIRASMTKPADATPAPKPAAPVRPVAHATFTVDEFGRMLTEFGRTGKVTRTPKDGDALGSFTPDGLDALPEGAQFVGPTHDPADPGGPGYIPLTKGTDGRWHGLRTPLTSAAVSMLSGRTLVLPVTKRTPKDGDRLDSFTAAELDGLPVGARFDDNNGGLSPLVKGPHGWSRAGAAGFCTSADMRSLGLESRTLVLPKPAASPKVGDRLRDLTPEQRANLPIGTVVTRICLGREASAVLTLDRASGSSDVTGAVWLVTFNGETREVPAEDLADDNAIVILPTLPPPPPAPTVGDKWGALNDDQRAALPAGTVLDGTGSLPPVVKVGSGWVCVEDGGKVGGFVPERTIVFLPVSK